MNKQKADLDVLEECMYSSYRFNRNRSPDVKPSRWLAVYVSQELFEDRYQKEKNNG